MNAVAKVLILTERRFLNWPWAQNIISGEEVLQLVLKNNKQPWIWQGELTMERSLKEPRISLTCINSGGSGNVDGWQR